MPATTKPSHFCSRCCKSFTRAWNLRRHQQDRKAACTLGEHVGKLTVRDAITGRPRLENKHERVARVQRKKREYYCRNVQRLRAKARTVSHRRRGARQGSMPEEERRKIDRIKWRRIIRAVYWREKGELSIFLQGLDLARVHSPGDKDVTPEIKNLYKAMKRIFAGYPEYWDATRNTWNEENFDHEDSGGEPFSDLERIYAASAYGDDVETDADEW